MNAQRWIAVGFTMLIVLCIATSGIWLELLQSSEDEEATAETTPEGVEGEPTQQGNSPEQVEASEATPTPFLFNDTSSDETQMEEEVDPLVADLLAALEQESLGIGEDPFITRAGVPITPN